MYVLIKDNMCNKKFTGKILVDFAISLSLFATML